MTGIDYEQRRADWYNQTPGKLDGPNCTECLNRGDFMRVDDQGKRYMQECRCMAKRRSLAYIRKSGLSELLERYTLDTWESREPWQAKARRMAENYAAAPSGWFYMAGRPGTGKTHLCTALCGLLLEQGYEARYMLWRDVSVQAKALVNEEEEYQALVRPLKRVRVLYIDDLFKARKGQDPTAGDVNLAFEIVNARYNDSRLLTIISSEWTLDRILDIDEGLGSRIYQRAKENYADLTGRENWRMR